jgi:hypothetical protein
MIWPFFTILMTLPSPQWGWHFPPWLGQSHPSSTVQVAEQPSPPVGMPLSPLPSSHCSLPVLRPSPQTDVDTHG